MTKVNPTPMWFRATAVIILALSGFPGVAHSQATTQSQLAPGTVHPGKQETFDTGHGHLAIGAVSRDFSIDSCTIQPFADQPASVSAHVERPGFRLQLSASSVGRAMTQQMATVLVGKPPAFTLYRASRIAQSGHWRDAEGQLAAGPLLTLNEHSIRVKGQFTKLSATGKQSRAEGTIDIVCGG